MQLLGWMTGRGLRIGGGVLVFILLALSVTMFYEDLPSVSRLADAVIHKPESHHESTNGPSNGASDDTSHDANGAGNDASHGASDKSNDDQLQGQDDRIPNKIWQISLNKKDGKEEHIVDPKNLQDTPSWLALNTDYKYTLVGEKGGDDFVRRYFSDNAALLEAYDSMWNIGMKSDLLRYLILDIEGGVYTDTDTVALKSIDKWVPLDLHDDVHVIVGIEYDRRDDAHGWGNIPHDVSLCQWTIAAAPNHPLFKKMVAHILRAMARLSETHNKPLREIHPTDFEVLNSTGPAAWTDVVFQQLQEYEPSLNETKDLSFMTEPTLFGDVLILPIDGFGMGQRHSHSTNDGSIPDDAFVKHLFRGSWRGQKFKRWS